MASGYQHLSGAQLTDAELALWDKYKDVEEPDVFSHLMLANDGGFSEVKDLYFPARWLTAAVLILFVLYNVYYVIELDVNFITDPEEAVKKLGANNADQILGTFYFSKGITDKIGKLITGDDDWHCRPVKLIGCLELVGLAYYLICIMYYSVYVSVVSDGYLKWYRLQKVCWELLPDLSAYSAMKLLTNIVPTIFVTKLFEHYYAIQGAIEDGRSKAPPLCSCLCWILVVVFGFIVGFDTFLMKMRVVSVKASAKDIDFKIVLPCLQFLVQVLGIVQLGPFVRKRLFVFIFGGEDGIMQDEEIELMDTWNALLARRMHRELPFHKLVAVLLSFSDEDFQSLVLNEDAQKKAEEVDIRNKNDPTSPMAASTLKAPLAASTKSLPAERSDAPMVASTLRAPVASSTLKGLRPVNATSYRQTLPVNATSYRSARVLKPVGA